MSRPVLPALLLATLCTLATHACSLFQGAAACDDAMPCDDGLVCRADGFCGAPDDEDPADAGPGDGGRVDGGDDGDAGILPVPTTTALTRAPEAVELAQPVALTATVTTTDGAATAGDVTFDGSTDDGATWSVIAAAPVDAQGEASITDVPLIDGVVYRARYAGTAAFLPSTSAATEATAVTLPTTLAATTVTLTRTPEIVTLGADVSLAVAVRTPDAAGAPVGAGAVTIQMLLAGDVWQTVTSAPLQASGDLALAHTPAAKGSVQYRALFGGDETHAPSLSAATPAATVMSPTFVALSRTPATTNVGDAITIDAVVRAPDAAGAPVTTGVVTVQRSSDSVVWSDVAAGAPDGAGAFSTTDVAAAPGALLFRATYGGDTFLQASTSATTDATPIAQPTTTTLTFDPATVNAGEAVTLQASVDAPPAPEGVATGFVAFDSSPDDGATWQELGIVALAPGGTAQLDDHPTRDGVVYRARFLGAGAYAPSTSTTTSPVAVVLPPDLVATEVALARDPATLTLGAQVSLQATVVEADGGVAVTNGTVTLQASTDGVLWQDVAQGALDGSGVVAAPHTPTSPGPVLYRALYGGGAVAATSYAASTSQPTPPAAVISPTVTTVARSPAVVNAGTSVAVTATVRAPDGGGAAVTQGDVAIERSSDGGAWTLVATVALNASGQASASHAPGAEARVVYRARFLGTSYYAASTSADSAAAVVRHLVAHSKTWTATWSRTYYGSGSARADAEFMSFCIQGQYSSNNGNQKCAFGFNDGNIRSTLAGAVIVDAKLYLYWDHWAIDATHDVFIGTHNSSSGPATFGALAGLNTNRRQEAFAQNQSKTFSVGVAIGNELRDGTARGFTLGPAQTTAQSSYGYAAGATQANPPKLVVDYQTWE